MTDERKEFWVNMKSFGKDRSADLLVALIVHRGQLLDSSIDGPGGRRELSTMPNWFNGELRISLPANVDLDEFKKRARVQTFEIGIERGQDVMRAP